MTAPRRLIDAPDSAAERVIALAAGVGAYPLRPDGWDDVMARAINREPGALRLAPMFVVSFLFGVGLVLWAQPTPSRLLSAAPVAHATPTTRWSSVSPDEVRLQFGRLSVSTPSRTPLRIRTPDAVFEVTGSRFLAEVISGGTLLEVEEGEVVLRSNGVMRTVKAGESILWPPAPTIPGPLLERAPALDSHCVSLPQGERRACLRREADGGSLGAQAALYELGAFEVEHHQREAGLRAWRESLLRFPNGVLHPEVRLALLIELIQARRFAEARLAAVDFEANCSRDPRVVDVKSLRHQLTERANE